MEDKTNGTKNFDSVWDCRYKLAFISSACNAMGLENLKFTDDAIVGLSRICGEIREQLDVVQDYLEVRG